MSHVWIETSLPGFTSKKKKLKIKYSDGDFEEAFDALRETVSQKLLKPAISGSSIPSFTLQYKPEDNLEADGNALDDDGDFEGMLDGFPEGKGVRVLVSIEDEGLYVYFFEPY